MPVHPEIASNIEKIINTLAHTPQLLEEIIEEIPERMLKQQRIPGKWTIHEHACHICVGDHYVFHPRLAQFKQEEHPDFKPYSGESFDDDYLINMNLTQALQDFKTLRAASVEMAQNLSPSLWNKEGDHPEYTMYTPAIMIRHFVMHDYYHLYRIEELWLTKEGMF